MNYIPVVEISNEEKMPAIMMGTFQHTCYDTLKEIVREGVKEGFTGFDTAYNYGNETDLGQIVNECINDFCMQRGDFYLTDKIDIWHMLETNGDITEKVDDALRKLNTEYLDLLLIHWPLPGYFEKTWETFIKIYEEGKTKAIGVSNIKKRHLKQMIEHTGFKPHVIQNERHPLRLDKPILDYCKDSDIVYQAYSPVCRMIEPLTTSMELQTIAEKYEKTLGQVILRWHLQTGSVPVFMTQKTNRINEYAAVFDFELEEHEINSISSLNENYKLIPESMVCPGF